MRSRRYVILLFIICFICYIGAMVCPIKFLTGISCGGCGMTRAALALGKMDIKEALVFHPLIFVVPVYIAVYVLKSKMKKKTFDTITFFTVTLFLGVYIIRLINPYDKIITVNIEDGFIFKITKEIMEVLFNG